MGTLTLAAYDATALLSLTGLRESPASCSPSGWGSIVDDLSLQKPPKGRHHGPVYTALSDFEDKVVLHTGRHSTVWSARCRRTGRIVVVKAYMRHKLKPRQLLNVQREITLLRLFSQSGCPGVVKLLAHFDDQDSMCLVCEACMRGDLYQSLLKSKGGLSEAYVCAKVVVPLLGILHQTHKLSIVHRDIKPENIFITLAGDIQLGDFGLAVHKLQDNLTERVGTLDYMAPEVLAMPTPDEMANKGKKPAKVPYDEKVDIWAVGVLVYELLAGRPPFEVEDAKETARLILAGRVPVWPSAMSALATDFIRAALSKAPGDRPAAEELLRHGWVRAHVCEADMPARAAKTLKEMLEAGSRANSQHNLKSEETGCGPDYSPSSLANATSLRKALSLGDDPFLMDQASPIPLSNPHLRNPGATWALKPVASAAAVLGGAASKLRLLQSAEPLQMAQRSHSTTGVRPRGCATPSPSLPGALTAPPAHLQFFDYGATGRRASSGTSEFLLDSPSRSSSSPPCTSDDGHVLSPPPYGAATAATAAATTVTSAYASGGYSVAPRAASSACLGDRVELAGMGGDGAHGDAGAQHQLPPAAALPAAYSRSFTTKSKPVAKSRFG